MKHKILKKIGYLVLTILTFSFYITNVNAASISVSASKTSLVKGNTVNVTVNYYSANFLSSGEGTLSYDKNILQLTSGVPAIDFIITDDGVTTKTISYTFKAINSGTSSVSVNAGRVLELKGPNGWVNASSNSVSIKVNNETIINPNTYSSNNYLKSLTIDGKILTPTFNKDTLEYFIELDNDVRKIKINATKEDTKAKITGDGEKDLSEGINKLEIKVEAENGNTKTYIINAIVKELDPVVVKIDGEEYNVVRDKEDLEKPSNYEEKTTKINDEDVPSVYNEKTGYTIVGLKNKLGSILYYIYNPANNTYKPYHEFSFNKLTIHIIDMPSKELNKLKDYHEVKIKIGDSEVTGYKIKNSSDFTLIYGINLETGKENIYKYDKVDNTIQRYTNEEVKPYLKENKLYKLIIICGVIGIALIITICLIISIIKNKKKKRKVNNNFSTVEIKKDKVKEEIIEDEKPKKVEKPIKRFDNKED